MFKLCYSLSGWFIARKAAMGMSGTLFFWQQVSPYYVRKGNALGWAKSNNKPLIDEHNPFYCRGVQ